MDLFRRTRVAFKRLSLKTSGLALGIWLALVSHWRPRYVGHFEFGAFGLTVFEGPSLIEFIQHPEAYVASSRARFTVGVGDRPTSTFIANAVKAAAQASKRTTLLDSRASFRRLVLKACVVGHELLPRKLKIGDQYVINVLISNEYNCDLVRRVLRQSLTLSEEGVWKNLEEIGIRRDARLVCLAVRSPSFVLQRFQEDLRSKHIRSEETQSHRNSILMDYTEAIQVLASRGYTVVRVGAGPPIPDNWGARGRNLGVVDYANSDIRSSELDIFLADKAFAWLLGGISGILNLAYVFDKPFFVANWIPLWGFAANGSPHSSFMPKLFKDVRDGSLLTCSAMAQRPWFADEYFEAADITVVDNQPDLIAKATAIWIQQIERSASLGGEHNKSQERFREIYRETLSPQHKHPGFVQHLDQEALATAKSQSLLTISPAFLQEYPWWLA